MTIESFHRPTLAMILVDIALAKKAPTTRTHLLTIAADVATGKPTALDKIMQPVR